MMIKPNFNTLSAMTKLRQTRIARAQAEAVASTVDEIEMNESQTDPNSSRLAALAKSDAGLLAMEIELEALTLARFLLTHRHAMKLLSWLGIALLALLLLGHFAGA